MCAARMHPSAVACSCVRARACVLAGSAPIVGLEEEGDLVLTVDDEEEEAVVVVRRRGLPHLSLIHI